MPNKKIFTILLVIGLLAVLRTTAYAATNAHPATPSIVGTWKMSIAASETSPEGLEVLMTFFADDNYMETINIGASTTAHHRQPQPLCRINPKPRGKPDETMLIWFGMYGATDGLKNCSSE